MKDSKNVYLGIKAHVVCINVITGKEEWRTKIKRSQIISIAVESDTLVAHAGGELFGLKKSSGEIIWRNPLSGLGYGYCFIASENSDSSAQMHNAIAAISSSDANDDVGAD